MASNETHVALIRRLEREARESPRAYRARVGLLALLGFAVLAGSILLAFGLSVGLVVALIAISPILLAKLIKLIWIPIALGWMMLRALWVRIDPPEGYRLQPGEAPALVAEVERLRLAAGAPAIAAIIIDDNLNAGAATVPRALGLLGNRHYLVLGLPLLQALDRAQLTAVIAHEFGHFGGGHGRFAGWVYHVRISWMRVLEALSTRRSMLTGMFTGFFNWYVPYFNAYTFVLARDNEYEADAIAAGIAGRDVVAQALVRTDACSRRLEQAFWPEVRRSVLETPQPPEALHRMMAERLRAPDPEDEDRLRKALARAPDYDDTHPTLAQRVAALSTTAVVAVAEGESAAEAMLGDLLPTLESRFSREWHDAMSQVWTEEHASARQGAERLAELRQAGASSPEARVEYALLVDRLGPDADAIPLLRDAAEAAPRDAVVRFRLGDRLLDAGDSDGADELWRAIELDPDCTEPACMRLYAHYREIGDEDGVAWVERTMSQLAERYTRDGWARERLDGSADALEPHGLSEEAVATIRAELLATGKVRTAWLVCKRIDDPAPGAPPHFLLLVKLKGLVVDEDSTLQRLADGVTIPGSCMVFTRGANGGVARRIQRIPGARIVD